MGEAIAKNPISMNAGRGFKGPAPSANTVHKTGSQGRHK